MSSDLMGAYLGDMRMIQEVEDLYRWVASLVAKFQYKPGWVFDLHRDPEHHCVLLDIMFRTEDSRRGPNQIPSYRETYIKGEPSRIERDDLIPIQGRFAVPWHLMQATNSEDRFYDWLRHTIGTVEDHERDEWFRVDGRLMYDPHIGEY